MPWDVWEVAAFFFVGAVDFDFIESIGSQQRQDRFGTNPFLLQIVTLVIQSEWFKNLVLSILSPR